LAKFVRENVLRSRVGRLPTLLPLATLGDITQIKMILSVSRHPRWPMVTVVCLCRRHYPRCCCSKLRQCKHSFSKLRL